uniref:FAT domain-containing protein n=1 Tax=Heterorhabditis bacteriophora TaxID=37862 RepID=A0A1I7XH10_HETBA
MNADGLRRLAYEWVMSSLLDAWRQGLDSQLPYWMQKAKVDYRTLYQEACNHYTYILQHSTSRRGNRLAAYQLTSRMLNGANPLHTWTAVCKVKRERIETMSGRGSTDRAEQPDAFHLHVLCKLHDDMQHLCEKVK